ncbi:MAG: hypothetical protein B7Z75_04000 [Acidocella sp. 20-57-95]|nr:MAG: hypothetical protein B7Z75_04000 [Acidocella sp. 20-57-95]OYV57884.1 MAG: hypothetical protein B7Z71_11760 [Acidocella sp. 21-58-7]HQT63907.1 hypothetical protein [Acidocella sp.]HQU05444.1 hypothetical protein [Acidocella sp.]
MDGVRLADRLAYGAGCAARRVGFLHDAYRPDGGGAPTDPAKRFLRLAVAFVSPNGGIGAPSLPDAPYRQAWADWSYLRVGDYLAGPEGCVFVAAIEPPRPMLVVMTNDVISLWRPQPSRVAGVNPYGAPLSENLQLLIEGFPASLLVGGLGDRTRAGLPDDTRVPGFIALLPAVAAVTPRVADIVVNSTGDRFLVTAVEPLAAVWRISLVQAVS